jgi:hypothetical protein
MLEQIQTTIRIFIIAGAGVAVVALARPSAGESAATLRNAPPVLSDAPTVESIHAPHGEKSGFAIFCPDSR